jgi:hypothetical protein
MQSFSAAQVSRLAARGAAHRADTLPVPITFRGATISVILSGLQETNQLVPGGAQETISAVMRIQRNLLTSRPVLDETFVVIETGLEYRIAGVTDSPRSPEWVLTISTVAN